MDELTKLVMQKTGLGADQAKVAVETVLNFIKGRLPAPMASQLDDVVNGKMSGIEADVSRDLGGLFGKK